MDCYNFNRTCQFPTPEIILRSTLTNHEDCSQLSQPIANAIQSQILHSPEASIKCKAHAKRWYDGGQFIQQGLCFAKVFKDEGDVICVLQIDKALASNNLDTGVLKAIQCSLYYFIDDEVEQELG
ncbi:hypothetical protein T265_08641 [Opisthorchis viverrini]|uniref:Uncharacterized protein n=1 Tax=Opisthorchis viverrini TaxID=6198 RepID=A0A074ZJD5_OPIVI|nr:hypothetical protein T265_08641 [Opisthorchis viverrini]KER23475.1 hypothetical protein T265_08641 [Opisthorchis viverrini]